ncbi:MAG: 5-(carboxyamino)imidazole ribonucleotide mutase [Bacillota bacterium]
MAQPLVGIVMGSDSDLPRMKECLRVLDDFGVAGEMRILSAHRVPDEVARYGREARDRGLKVLVAGAGLAAHLPGVLAAYTTLPVIGVPLSAGALNGLDALYAVVQMPPGVPVATVGLDGARNAGLLAVQMLALGDPSLAGRLEAYRQEMAETVRRKDLALAESLKEEAHR